MTELELFPRGKGISTASSSRESRTVSSSSNRARDSHASDGREENATSRKRKAPGAVPGQKADERDWLFGAPKTASKTRTPLKETKSPKYEAASEVRRKVSSSASGDAASSIVEERHGRSSRLTSLSSKSLVKGTLVLGVVFKVHTSHILVSLPAGSTGVVRKSEVSDYFYAKATAQHLESFPEAPSDPSVHGKQLDTVLSMDCELSDIFHVGQVLRCGILLTKEADRRRFDLTLRASLINRGLSLSHLKEGCGIYGCIVSTEDHGFVASLGLDGVTAFVPLSQAPKQGFKIGQPVEAVITKVKAAARTVTLSTDPGMVASALSTGSGFDLRSIKPGMLVETEVDKVLPNGITVTFLEYFSGCVDHDNMPVVSTDCKDDPKGWRELVKSEPKGKARVLMVNYALKAFRLTMRPHLLALERPSGLPPLRSLVKAKVLRIDSSRGLLLKVMPSDDGEMLPNGSVSLKSDSVEEQQGEKSKTVEQEAPKGEKGEESSTPESQAVKLLKNGGKSRVSSKAGAGGSVIGAYVHVTKINEAGKKTENLRKLFPRGKEVICRVLRDVTLEGLVSASLRPSHLSTSATRYEELCAGQVVEGEMMSANEVGIVVKLGEGLRALVRKNDIGEVRVNKPSSRFKVGARVKGRVLKVNLQRRRAFLTLKKSMVDDQRPPLKKYHQATPGKKCLGMVVKVGTFGLHVAFYNGVVGLVPMRHLKKHGVDYPLEAFRVGQTTGCRVLKCNWRKRPVRLVLGLDVPGKVDEEEAAAPKAKKGGKPFRAEVGDMVRGVVAEEQEPQRAIAVDLYPLLPSSDGAEGQEASRDDEAEPSQEHATKTKRGYLMLEHVGDNVSVCRSSLRSALKPGTQLSRLLVYGASRTGAPLVTMKPLLLFAASHRPSRKRPRSSRTAVDQISIPSRIEDVSPGDVVAGYVSSIKEFGVFVSFVGGFSALCRRSFLVDERLPSPEKRFTLGDSVRCVVRRVNTDSGIVSVDLRLSQVPPSSLLYTRSLLWEMFTAMAVSKSKGTSKHHDASEKGQRKPLWARFECGMNLKAKVIEHGEDGVFLETGDEGEEQRMLCPPEHTPDAALEVGAEVEVRVLGVDADTGMLDVTMDSDLVKAGKDGKKQTSAAEVESTVSARVILAKPRSKFAVAARQGSLFVVQVADFNCSARTNTEAGFSTGLPGQAITARVGDTVTTEAEGFWEAQRDGPLGHFCCNPYAGVQILVPTDDPMSKGRKPGGARDGATGEYVSERKKRRVEPHKLMKTGKIPLKDMVPGAEVTCQVSSVRPDCLNVKVAVKFAKIDPIATGRSEDGGDVEDGVDVREPRVRARIHCAWAGKPDVDAPSVTSAEEVVATPMTEEESEAQFPVWHPLKKYREGQVLKARVLLSEDKPSKNKEARPIRLFELGMIKVCDDGEAASQSLSPKPEALPWWGRRVPQRREVYRGVVSKSDERGVKVSLSSSVDGFLPWKFVEESSGDARALFKRGMGVRVQVFHVDEAEHRVVLTRKGLPSSEVLPDSELPTFAPKGVGTAANTAVKPKRRENDEMISTKYKVGDIVEGRVSTEVKAILPPCLMVRLRDGQIGRVCITEVADEDRWEDNPLLKFEDGRQVTCRVLPSSLEKQASAEAERPRHQPLELSLRPSRLKSNVDPEASIALKGAPEVGLIVKAYVEETTKVGCFVRLSVGTRGRVMLKELHDRFLPNPGEMFPAGKLVVGKALAQDDGQVSLTLKRTEVADGTEQKLNWSSSDLKPGLKIKGNVSSVQSYGAFIDLDDSNIRGMAHRSEAADHSIEDMTSVFEVGDRVKAVVLKVDKRKKRLSLGLKPSYFEGDPDSSSDEDEGDGHGEDGEDELGSTSKGATETEMPGAETQATGSRGRERGDDEESVGGGDGGWGVEERDAGTRKRSRGVFTDTLDMGDGGAANAFGLDFGHFGSRVDRKDETESEDEESSDERDEDAAGGAGHRSRKKARERREEEERTVAKETALLDEDAAPETNEDFERLVIASPNDSLIWVQYMAFKLSLADIDDARSVAERALKTISFRLEQERFNVWVSLLNLEHKFGSSKSLRDVMERACQNTNPKKVYLHMAQIHAKAKELEESGEVYESAVKKFRHSKKVWMAYQLSRLERGDASGAREILQRSLQSLAKHKHVQVISRFAQNEFELGSVERGRTIFEGLMASYPKRLDLWNVYVDKEIKAGQLDAARNLLERMTGMEFNAKRMKGVFKKYLQFETEHGNEAGVQAVKAKATEYVASIAG